jgi:glutamyl-tRNA synthetase
VSQILKAASDRIKVAGDILDYEAFFVADESLAVDAAAFDKRIRQSAAGQTLLARFRDELATVEPFTPGRLEELLHVFVAARGVKTGDLVHAVRVAVTGKAVGFGLFDTLAILGRERCLARIDRALRIAAEGEGKTP